MAFYEELKKVNPELNLHLTLYPYTLRMLVPGTPARREVRGGGEELPAVREWTMNTWRRWGEMFPDDVTFCIRETVRENVEAFRELWPHGLYIWNGLGCRTWTTLYDAEQAFMRTYFRDKRDFVMIAVYGEYYVPLRSMAAREYAWNVEAPGPADFRFITAQEAKACTREGEVFEVLLPRIVRNLFGRQAAPDIVEAVKLNIAPNQIFDERGRYPDLLRTSEDMFEQADRADQAARAVDRVWEALSAGEISDMDERGRLYLAWLREVFHNSRWTARVRGKKLRAREAARAGKPDEGKPILEEAQRLLDEMESGLESLLAERPSRLVQPARIKYMADGAGDHWRNHDVGVSGLRERVERTGKELPALARPIPADAVRALAAHRKVRAVRTEARLALDGTLSDPAWERAWPEEAFFVHREGVRTEVAGADTRARVLYDDEYLYVAFECRPAPGMAVNDLGANREHVEVLIQPGSGRPYSHFLAGMGGWLRQQKGRPYEDRREGWGVDRDWESEGARSEVHVGDDRWNVMLKIPLQDVAAGRPRRGWTINLGRGAEKLDGSREWSSTQPPGAVNNHDFEKFRPLVFAGDDYYRPEVQVAGRNLGLEMRTLPDGIVTVARFGLSVDATQVLTDVNIRAEAYGPGGALENVAVWDAPDRIYYGWESAPPHGEVEFGGVHGKGGIRIVLDSAEGVFESWLRFGGWKGTEQTGRLFGHDGDGGYLAGPAWFPGLAGDHGTPAIASRAGTIEFHMKPGWRVQSPPPGRRSEYGRAVRWILRYGSDSTGRANLANVSNLSFYFTEGRAHFSVANSDYVRWSCTARVDELEEGWRFGRWRHVALVWDAAAERDDWLRIYFDGKRVSGGVSLVNEDRLDADKSVRVPEAAWPVQLGSADDGRHVAAMGLRGLRISRQARYGECFRAPGYAPEVDGDTAAAFSFDGSLSGEGSDGSRSYALRARSGALRWEGDKEALPGFASAP